MKLKFVLAVLPVTLLISCASKSKNNESAIARPETKNAANSTPTPSESSQAKSSAAKASHSDDQALKVCHLKKDERKIEIKSRSPKGCEVEYSKFGKETAVASSKIGPRHCVKTSAKIEDHLKAAGFSCE